MRRLAPVGLLPLLFLGACAPKIVRAARKGDASAAAAAYPGAMEFHVGLAVGEAAMNGHEAALKVLLDLGADPDGRHDLSGAWVTALMLAAKDGRVGTARMLLDYGASVNAQPNNNRTLGTYNFYTALIFAAKGGHADVVKLLLERGAATNLRGGRTPGRTAQEWAEKEGHAAVALLIEEAERGGARTVTDRRHTEGVQSLGIGKALRGAAAIVPGGGALGNNVRALTGVKQDVFSAGAGAAGAVRGAGSAAQAVQSAVEGAAAVKEAADAAADPLKDSEKP
jgi:hypothetical protein